MTIDGVPILDTYAEAFPMTAARVIVTAATPGWAQDRRRDGDGLRHLRDRLRRRGRHRARTDARRNARRPARREPALVLLRPRSTGTSRLQSRRPVHPDLSDDGVLQRLARSIPDKSLRVGGNLRFFGDGWQYSKKLDGRRFWRMPVMDGEFLCEDRFGTAKGVAGGNFLILAESQEAGLPRPRRPSQPSRRSPASSRRFPAASSAAAARSAAVTRNCGPAPTTPTVRPCAAAAANCPTAATRSTKSSSTASICRLSKKRPESAFARPASPASWRSAPETTAANSGRFCYICENSWGDRPNACRRQLST